MNSTWLAMSGAEPCIGSKSPGPCAIFQIKIRFNVLSCKRNTKISSERELKGTAINSLECDQNFGLIKKKI
jgi:hypothetical protein